MPYDSVGLFLHEGHHLRLVSGVGLPAAALNICLPLNGDNITVRIFKQGQAEAIAEVSRHPHWQLLPAAEKICSTMAAPLLIDRQALGVLTLDYFTTKTFTPEDVAILQALANQAALVLKNAELYRQAQTVAALEERNRLAQELHDAVNQTLFTASIMAEAVPQAWAIDPDHGRRGMAEVRRLTKVALAEMRTLLLELRPQTITEKPLGQLLAQLTQIAAGRSPIELIVENDALLPPDRQLTFYRIAQESLHNLMKHAQADHCRVYLNCQPHRVSLQIQDNGRGFNFNDVPPDRLGLFIMRERAAKIGASLTITSQRGQGTQISLIWPEPAEDEK